MSKIIDLTGKRYGMLTVLEQEKNYKEGKTFWRCKCDCGNTAIIWSVNLRKGQTKSCGCLRRIIGQQKNRTHNMSKTRLYKTWAAIKARCCHKTQPAYKSYGARGIKMCDDWKNSFENFSKWAFSSGYDDTMTIERINVNGDYCPENCKWIPFSEQARNKRSNILFKYNGEIHCLSEWCEIYQKDYDFVYNRIHKHKWSFERAMFEPVHTEKRNKQAQSRKR